MVEMPEGCSKTLQISFIKDENLRPEKEYKWLVEARKEGIGGNVVTCLPTLEESLEFAKRFIGE